MRHFNKRERERKKREKERQRKREREREKERENHVGMRKGQDRKFDRRGRKAFNSINYLR